MKHLNVVQMYALPFHKHTGHIVFAYLTAYLLMGSDINFVAVH
jgi:hypothetical protein